MTDKNLGHATAYGYAKSKGYTGTEEEFAELMASYAEVAESAKGYAEQAEASATNAETSETNARTSAQTASAKASEASASASNAQTSASNAQASATSAGTSASSASASAQMASTKASEASDSATSASESASTAVSAKDDAVTAKESAETAKADAETAAEEAQESAQTVENKADKDGTYPDMTVGGVMSSDGSTDSTPYLYRVSGGGVKVGTVEEDSIVGGTVAFNQLVQNGNFESDTLWVNEVGTTHSIANGILTLTTGNANNGVRQNGFACVTGHKYVICAESKCDEARRIAIGTALSFGVSVDKNIGSEWTAISAVVACKVSSDNTPIYIFGRNTTLPNAQVRNFCIFDLTQMFGSTIADYIYSLEQSSTGAGVAFFRKLFPKDYYEYNTGELMSVEGVSAHVMRDADDNIIGNYPLDSSLTLRGIPKVADGKMYFDGDTYSADGKVVRKYGVITATEIKANYNGFATNNHIYSSYLRDALNAVVNQTPANAICNILQVNGTWTEMQAYSASGIYHNSSWDYTRLYLILPSTVTTKEEAETWLDNSGIEIVYELATPTIETAEPYESIQKVSKYGTEEYVSTSIVPVGHVTKYPTDIVAKVNGLPSDFSTLIAPTEKEFKASRAYSVNQFIIVDNQLYRVTSAIASGATITVGTNVVATTIADILTSLLNA